MPHPLNIFFFAPAPPSCHRSAKCRRGSYRSLLGEDELHCSIHEDAPFVLIAKTNKCWLMTMSECLTRYGRWLPVLTSIYFITIPRDTTTQKIRHFPFMLLLPRVRVNTVSIVVRNLVRYTLVVVGTACCLVVFSSGRNAIEAAGLRIHK